MNDGTLVRKNLFRRTLRTILLIVSIFIAFLMFGVLGSFNEAFRNAPNEAAAANRMLVVNKINFTQPLPYAYLERIRAVPGVALATNQNWFGGYYREPRNLLQTFSVDVESFSRIMREDLTMPEEQWRAFLNDRIGIIISRPFAEQHNLRVGQRIPLHSNIFTNKTTGQQVWEFNVVGIFEGQGNPNSAFFNYEYFRESDLWGGGNTSQIVIETTDPSVNDAVARRIDAMFANSPAETATQDMRAFVRAFIAQYGDIGFIITLVVGAAFIAILMVVGNTMVMAVRERTKEIGVMKTLGFSSGRIVRMVLGESLLLSLIGAGLGLGFGALMLAGVGAASEETFGGLRMSPLVAAAGAALAIAFGLLTGLWPALSAFNLRIVDALGRK